MDMVNTLNDTIRILTSRRTIRKFTDEPVSAEHIEALEASAQQTATSESLSSWSAIRVHSKETREAIASICGHARIAIDPLLYVFVLDQHRNIRIATEHGVDPKNNPLATFPFFLQAYDDAVLALHAMETAANSLGLGAVILGAIQNDAAQIIELLHLPNHVYPVLGLAIGHPAKVPEIKPRPPRKQQFFDDYYPDDADVPNLTDELKDFDQSVHDYYARRNPDNPIQGFTQYVTELSRSHTSFGERPTLPLIEKQGFRVS